MLLDNISLSALVFYQAVSDFGISNIALSIGFLILVALVLPSLFKIVKSDILIALFEDYRQGRKTPCFSYGDIRLESFLIPVG